MNSNNKYTNIRKTKPSILVVDDEQHIRDILCEILSSLDYNINSVENGEKAIEEVKKNPYDMIITDLMMPRMGGLELLKAVKTLAPNVVVIIMTGFGTITSAVDAMKQGAYEYVLKPFKIEELVYTIKRGIEKRLLEMKNVKLKEAIALLQLNEAIDSGIEEEKILSIIIDTTLREIDADVVICLLKNEETGRFETKLKHSKDKKYYGKLLGEVENSDVDKFFEQDVVFLFDKEEVVSHFGCLPQANKINSFISIPLKIKNKVVGVINAYSFTKGRHFTEGQCKSAAIIAGRAASIIDNTQLYESAQKTFKETVKSFAYALEAKDKYTQGHSEKVTLYSDLICDALNLSNEETEMIRLAAQLHDIGKIGIVEDVLNKPGKLNDEEYKKIKEHSVMGTRILEPLHFLRPILPIIHHHHEKYDGTGYPDKIKGGDIPLGARIIAVGDAYDAMTSSRSYRKGLSHEETIEELIRCSGTQFDPGIVEIFVKIMDKKIKR
jgi:response regulator RpfG family c-di-GMP phosphodiesterase